MIGRKIFKATIGIVGFMIVHAMFHYPDIVLLWDDKKPFSKEGALFYFVALLGMFLITSVCECNCGDKE